MQKKIKVISLMKLKKQKNWIEITSKWDRFFNIDHVIEKPSKLTDFKRKRVDVLFLDAESYQTLHLSDFHDFQKSNPDFIYVIVKDVPESTDFIFLKRLAADLIYTENRKLASWKTIAILRRHWVSYSKSTTVIYKDIIADFIESQVTLDGEIISLTSKEIKLLRFFLDNIGIYRSKDFIFKTVWNIDDSDTTRVVDQIFFKLKNKLGEDYFVVSRQKGIKFE